MHALRLSLGLVLLLSFGAADAQSVARPSPQELERAFTRHDTVELERLGSRLGAVRLCALAEHGTPPTRLAALGALELTSGSLIFLPRLVAIADSAADASIATAAIESARRIAERVPRGELDLDEVPADLPRSAVDAFMALASREDRPLALRVHAVTALAALTSLDAGAAAKLATLLSSRDPALRRAVAEALPASAVAVLGRLLTEEGTAEVALAAAGTLCRDIPPVGPNKSDKKGENLLARVAGLPAAARARLRELIRNAQLPALDRLDVVPCMRQGAQRPEEARADLELLRELGRGADESLKRRARAYGGR